MSGRVRVAGLVATLVVLLLLPHPVGADERDELSRTRKRLGGVQWVRADARADAGAVAAALAAADQAVTGARARLATATAELGEARRRRGDGRGPPRGGP